MSATPPSAPHTERNKQPIADVLADFLPDTGMVLEIASGTGQHAAWFAARFPGVTWQPTDIDPDALSTIPLWTEDIPNVRPVLKMDVTDDHWPVIKADAVVCCNMIHIAPWAAAEGLIAGAGRVLNTDGLLFLYGPFKRDGQHTAPSNDAFDRSLRQRNPDWGIRDLEEITRLASGAGLSLREARDMPANNLTLVFQKG